MKQCATKRRGLIWTVVMLVAVSVVALAVLMVGADETNPLDIGYCNLSFENEVHLMYAITSQDPNVKLLVWEEPDDPAESLPEEFVYGTGHATLSPMGTRDINGVTHTVFKHTGLTAMEMTRTVYARTYLVDENGEVSYGNVYKYSILQYAFNMLGRDTTEPEFKTMLDDMLQYGASAQVYFNYRPDRLANADWVQIRTVDGTLPDGFKRGLYLPGDEVSLTADGYDTDGTTEGEKFHYWKNASEGILSPEGLCTMTVGTANETLTAVEAIYSTGLAYTSNGDGTASVAKGTFAEAELYIPPVSPEGNEVTNIGNSAFYYYYNLTSIIIPDGVTSIGDSAFSGCRNLASITIPTSVTSIGNYAFASSDGVRKVYIADMDVWYNVSFNTNGTNPLGTKGELYLKGNLVTDLEIPAGMTSIGDYAFHGCYRLTSIIIPDSITSIGDLAFAGCSNLASITLPDSVTSIDSSAFASCSNLASITLPDSMTSIGSNAFSNCSSLTSITIPDGVKNIDICTFEGCSSLSRITLPDSVTRIESLAFQGCSSLTGITIPNGLTSIGGQAFAECGLTSITIPANVTNIGNSAFRNCGSLTSINIPDGVTSFGNSVFSGCRSLISITLPDNVTSIDSSVFYNCSNLTSITIPNGVTSIGDYAFHGCSSLTSITIPDNVTSIGYAAFYNCSSLTSITIPDSVTSIGILAFSNCTNLIQKEGGVHYVDTWAVGCDESVTSVTLREGTKDISGGAFSSCDYLKSITLPDSVTSIGERAFSYCKNLTSITLPSGVTSIGEGAFWGCSSLTSITIQSGVTSIGAIAFRECSSLTTITFTGTTAEWQAITMGSSWNLSTGTYTIYCTDGTIAKDGTVTLYPVE